MYGFDFGENDHKDLLPFQEMGAFLIFWEMELSYISGNRNLEKIPFILGNGTFLVFEERYIQNPGITEEIFCLLWCFCNLCNSKAQGNCLWSKFKDYMTILMFKEYKRFRYFVKYSCAQEMELFSPRLKKLLIVQEGTYRSWKSNKTSAPKKSLVTFW